MNFKKTAITSAVLTASISLISFAVSKIGYSVQQLYAISPVSAVSPTVGEKTLSFLAGYVPTVGNFTLPAIALLLISSFLILLVGEFLYGVFNFKVKGDANELASKILLGSAVGYVLVVGLVLAQWQVFVGLALHTLAAAYLTAWGVSLLE